MTKRPDVERGRPASHVCQLLPKGRLHGLKSPNAHGNRANVNDGGTIHYPSEAMIPFKFKSPILTTARSSENGAHKIVACGN